MIFLTPQDRQLLEAAGLAQWPSTTPKPKPKPPACKQLRRSQGLCLRCGNTARVMPDGVVSVYCDYHLKHYAAEARARRRRDAT